MLEIDKNNLSEKYNQLKTDIHSNKGKFTEEVGILEKISQYFDTHDEKKISEYEAER